MSLQVHFRKKLAGMTLMADFETDDGVLALLGASGSGKSMTLKCIAGIERPDEGHIELDGRVLFDSDARICLPPQERRVGYMFQDYALFPNMTVFENVTAGMRRPRTGGAGGFLRRHPRGGRGEMPGDVRELLARFHIEEIAERYPAQLSGGQKQRVAMARIIAQEPDAILLDEPFSALDSYLRWQLEREMKETLAAIGRPVLFVSHSRDEVYHLAARVCCISGGKTGNVSEVRAFFRNPGTRAACILSGCKNVAAAKRSDAHTIEVPEWGLTLFLERFVPEGTDGVGIRAHAFRRAEVGPREACDNRIPIREASVLEDPFEWTVSFRAAEGGGWLEWKLAKDSSALILPEELFLDSREIMLLTGQGRRTGTEDAAETERQSRSALCDRRGEKGT